MIREQIHEQNVGCGGGKCAHGINRSFELIALPLPQPFRLGLQKVHSYSSLPNSRTFYFYASFQKSQLFQPIKVSNQR